MLGFRGTRCTSIHLVFIHARVRRQIHYVGPVSLLMKVASRSFSFSAPSGGYMSQALAVK